MGDIEHISSHASARSVVQLALIVSMTGLAAPLYAQSVTETRHIGPFAGPNATLSGEHGHTPVVYGTDLGFPVVHDSKIKWLFGDTWRNNLMLCDPTVFTLPADDMLAYLPLASFSRGNTIDTLGHAPSLTVHSNTANPEQMIPIAFFNGTTQLPSAGGVVPAAPFVANNLLFAMRAAGPVTCSQTQPCPLGYVCVSGGCFDPTTSQTLTRSPVGKVDIHQESTNSATPETFDLKSTWQTAKFTMPASRTVNDFLPNRVIGNDYLPPHGAPLSRNKVFIWGRPGYAGAQVLGSEAKLYLAYVDVTATGVSAPFTPHYFTGTDLLGVPHWSDNPLLAVPLNLSGGIDPTHEVTDIPSWATFSFVAALGKWIMLYGGDLPDFMLRPGTVRPAAPAIYARFAINPWGPWSAPVVALDQGWLYSCLNPYANTSLLWSYLPGNCTTSDPHRIVQPAGDWCCGSTPICPLNPAVNGISCSCQTPQDTLDVGKLYGPNIVDQWTEDRSFWRLGVHYSVADIYWTVSTWNPYQVQLMRTRFTSVP